MAKTDAAGEFALSDSAATFAFDTPRLRLARGLCTLALFALPAFVIATPWGLRPATLFTLLAVCVAPDCVWHHLRPLRRPLLILLAVSVLVSAAVSLSVLVNDTGWREADSRGRALVMPVALLLTVAFRPPRAALWGGAVAGLLGAGGIALYQYVSGVARADGWTNAIVFGDLAAVLLVIVVFFRASGRMPWVVLGTLAGVTAIVLSGSRGTWPALVLIALTGLLAGRRARWWELLGVGALGLVTALVLSPKVEERITALQGDLARYSRGDMDSSSGARIQLLHLAGETFLAHPGAGIGVGKFDRAIGAQPICRAQAESEEVCRLSHAHNDVAEWGATMGVPGVLALALLYGVPLWMFARRSLARPFPRRSRSAALTGMTLVLVFVACGLTQSLFAHQLTSTSYVLLIGILLGFSLRENPQKD
ncbi:MAG: O-antigen ligase family protein [Pseudoxanthomonas sp.]